MPDETFKHAKERYDETRDDDVSPKGELFSEMKTRVHAGSDFSTRDLVLLLREDVHSRFSLVEKRIDQQTTSLNEQIMFLIRERRETDDDHEHRLRTAETRIGKLGLNALIARIAIPVIGAMASVAVIWSTAFQS